MTDDPEYQLARAEYLFPDSSNPDEKLALRIMAAARMRDLEAAAESGRKDDPGYLLAEACYRFPDADDVPGRDAARLDALFEMRAIRRRCDSRP